MIGINILRKKDYGKGRDATDVMEDICAKGKRKPSDVTVLEIYVEKSYILG